MPSQKKSNAVIRNATPPDDRLFIGVYPTGLVYADKTGEVCGDYANLAFLPYSTLKLEWRPRVPSWARPLILEDAKRLQAKRGEQFEVSWSGQTVTLGE